MDNDIDDEPPLLVASSRAGIEDGNSVHDTSGVRVPITIVTGGETWSFNYFHLKLSDVDGI